MKLFAGTSNPGLAMAVSTHGNLPLGSVEITRFIDNECRVFVKDAVEGEEVYILQSLSEVADQHLVELCLLGSAVKGLGAKKVTAIIPWMGYSKQDKAFRKGEAISAQLVAKFIEAAGFDAVITVELHSENVLPYFTIPVTELSSHGLLGKAFFEDTVTSSLTRAVVVSPDYGGVSRSARFAEEMKLPIIHLTKKRDVETGAVTVTGADGTLSGTTAIMFDDIINTGATAVKTSDFVLQNGAVAVYFLATHGVFAGNASRVLADSRITKVMVSDTINIPEKKKFPSLQIVSVASLIADAIQNQTK
ncbi:MAG: ribose-phosphate diphosphokinase [Patescibacteria group bacterium]